MNRLRLRAEGGFTLIELLVVIAIIGILAAIAIPQFASYRKKGYETSVKSDLRNAATAQEAYFVNANKYQSGTLTSGNLTGFNATTGVAVASGGGTNTFAITGTHTNCGATVWTFSSATGAITSPTGGCP
jgi:prepilin-type N-terminal cleavage/methylation domain-containing protein